MSENTDSIQNLDKNKINKCICKIECPSGGYVTGFFCKIPIPKEEHRLRTLITKYSILGIKSNDSDKEIKIILSNNQPTVLKISKDYQREIFADEIHDILMIQLNEKEDIDIFNYINLLYLDEEFYNYENESVYLIDFSGNNIDYSVGIIQQNEKEELKEDEENNEINMDKIEILCFNKKKSLGGPIILNNEVIGIHYGNENNEGYYWDSGIYILNFMFEYYGSIKEKLHYKRHKKEIKKINLDEIVLKKIKNKNLLSQISNDFFQNNPQIFSNQNLGMNPILLNLNSQNSQQLNMRCIPNLWDNFNNIQMNQFQTMYTTQNNNNLMNNQINFNQSPNFNQNINNIENQNINEINNIDKKESKIDENNIIKKENENENISNEITEDNNKNDEITEEIEFDDDSFEDNFSDEPEENENEQNNNIISKNDENDNKNKEDNSTNLMINEIQSSQKEKNDLIENEEKNSKIIEEKKDNTDLISNNSISTICSSNDTKISEKSENKVTLKRSKAIFSDKKDNNKNISKDNGISNEFEIIENIYEIKDLLPKEMISKIYIKENKDIKSNKKGKEIKTNIFEDIYAYINIEKKDIIFIMPNKEKKYVKIPKFFTNKELYFTAYFLIYREEEEIFIYKNLIKLNYKGKLLKYEDSLKNKFKNNEEIEIEEISIYENINFGLLKEGESKKKISIKFSDVLNFQKNKVLIVKVSPDITCNKLISCFSNLSFLDLERVKIDFNFNNKNIKEDNTTLKKYINNEKKEYELIIIIQNIFHLRRKPGKILSVIIKIKKKLILKKLKIFKVGSLETLSNFNIFLNEKLKKNLEKGDYILQKTFIIEGKKDIKIDLENNKDESKTLIEKGINKDFTCILSYKKKKKRFKIVFGKNKK